MRSIGFATIFLYIASIISFLLAAQYPDYYKPALVVSAVFFIAASGALLVMMRIRMEKQNF
jgi:hypothetical protein